MLYFPVPSQTVVLDFHASISHYSVLHYRVFSTLVIYIYTCMCLFLFVFLHLPFKRPLPPIPPPLAVMKAVPMPTVPCSHPAGSQRSSLCPHQVCAPGVVSPHRGSAVLWMLITDTGHGGVL